jgi:hypothetical protein
MNKGLYYKAFLFIVLSGFSCNDDSVKNDKDNETKEPVVTVAYEESTEDFVNPERGFYKYSETSASNYRKLNESTLRNYRSRHKSGGSYYIYSSLVFRYYILNTFKETDISEGFLENLEADFVTARNAGVKLIPRFTYTNTQNSGDCAEGFICPPYGDAPKDIVLRHIEQLGPILANNADVILAVQMGFIGTWGEQYYTDYFGDSSNNGTQKKLLDENWEDRIEVLTALLNVLPENIQVHVRYPQIKQRTVYGVNITPKEGAALTEAEAFTNTHKARIGFHNDCFLASSNDYGTYSDYGNSSTSASSPTTTLKKYFADDSKFVMVGGETCNPSYSQSDCSPNGRADTEMRDLHYTYLNSDYNNGVNNKWVTNGCMDGILRNLGYRIVLREAKFTKQVSKDAPFNVNLKLENVGFAAPGKSRPVKLVLRNVDSKQIITKEFNTNIRKWYSGETQEVKTTFDLSDVPAGSYELLMHLPDASESISNRVEYAIRVANTDVWEEESGFNKLNHTITIE